MCSVQFRFKTHLVLTAVLKETIIKLLSQQTSTCNKVVTDKYTWPLGSWAFRGTLVFLPIQKPTSPYFSAIKINNLHENQLRLTDFLFTRVRIDDPRLLGLWCTKGDQSRFIGSFDAPSSDWSWITNPDPNHLKGTQSEYCFSLLFIIICYIHILSARWTIPELKQQVKNFASHRGHWGLSRIPFRSVSFVHLLSAVMQWNHIKFQRDKQKDSKRTLWN